MRELRPGVWHWQSPHPDWDEEQWWPALVSSYAIEVGDEFLLFDPLSVPDELRESATAVVLTAPYHERDARGLGLPVHTPPADTWQDWVDAGRPAHEGALRAPRRPARGSTRAASGTGLCSARESPDAFSTNG